MIEKQLAEISLEDGTKFLVEIDEPETSAIQRASLPNGKQIVQVQEKFEQMLEGVKPVTSAIISKLRGLNTPADEVEVKFGLKLTADAGIVFASVGSEVSYEITLKWQQRSTEETANGQAE